MSLSKIDFFLTYISKYICSWLKTTTFHFSVLYYLTERRRSEEELREMDSKNKITEDMVSEFGTGQDKRLSC